MTDLPNNITKHLFFTFFMLKFETQIFNNEKVYTIVTQMRDYDFSILQTSHIRLHFTNILPYNGAFKLKILFLLFPFIFFSCGRSEKDM